MLKKKNRRGRRRPAEAFDARDVGIEGSSNPARMSAACSCVHRGYGEMSFREFFFSSRRRHTRLTCDWSSDVCPSDLIEYRINRAEAPVAVTDAAGAAKVEEV